MGAPMDSDPETEPLTGGGGGGGDARRLRILALWDDEHLTFPLPEKGTVTVGRAEGVELQVPDPAMSRHHIKLHLGERLQVEDLSSANGTVVRGRLLQAGETVEVKPGEMIELGRTMLLIQRAPAKARPVQLYAHEYFEARVDDECARGPRGGSGFAVVRTDAADASGRTVEERLAASLKPGDVLASYGPRQHELLWVACKPKAAEARAAKLLASLQTGATSASLGVACFPRDGRTVAALLERANAALRGPGAGEGTAPVTLPGGAMENLRRIVEHIAPSRVSVVITGETGVGKGLLAAELHRKSPRAAGPFVAINCGALTESLLEAELFGHAKDSFTGAHQAKPGLIETADKGTLFLDEIGEMSKAMQVKMLKVIDDGEVLRVGEVRPRKVDFRLVCCTHRDLEAEVERGNFRQDLFFRVNQFLLYVPPLRERPDEIEALAQLFVARAAEGKPGGTPPAISSEAMAVLRSLQWQGNVRELRNAMVRAVLNCSGGVVRPEDLPPQGLRTTVSVPPSPEPAGAREVAERQRIQDALAECAGNQTRAAALLGISRRTLVDRLAKLGMPRPRKKRG
jgi:two-component system, NtrC family, response regulator AtoC